MVIIINNSGNYMKKIILYFLFYFTCQTLHAEPNKNISFYLYEDTKQLVLLVEDAASLIEKKGEEAFKEFDMPNSKWFNEKYYLFVYDITGNCVFHPIEPSLMGQNLSQFKDLDKKPVISLITDIGKKNQPNASGWVFYLWETPWKSPLPRWKSSYIRKVIAPDGKIYLVGSGLYNIKIEKTFIQERVDTAAELILAKGKDVMFNELNNRSCPLHVLDTYITVADSNFNLLVDPSFPSLAKKRSLANFHDKTGRNITEELLKALKNKDRLWILYIWPRNETSRLARHTMYIRKIQINNETFYVFADLIPAMPVWMK